jgi:glycine betaine/proline transport system ATP-binding protein
MTDAAIDCRHLWKIFGADEAAALAAARDGVGKAEIRERFGCVVGVADVSFTVRPGEIFCVMGLSGSGKSTLVRHLNRLIEPSAGEIFIGGRDISKLGPAELRSVRSTQIGMVFQNMGLLPHRTVIDNVALPLELRGVPVRERHRIAHEKLALVDLTGWDDRYPDELSGGMRQRVGLARAMAADPEILLMDEPFSALDPLIRRQLQDQFIDLAKVLKKTTIFITHDLDEAIRLGDHIAIMKDGRIVQIGTPEDIVTAPADAYVADFVAGVSRLGLVTAGRVMLPLDGASDIATAPRVAPEATLDALLDIAAETDSPILVADGSGPVGWIPKRALIRGIQGKGAAA